MQRLMQEIIQDRNYFIESNYLRFTNLFSWIGSWKCPCLQVDIGFSMGICRQPILIQSFQHMNA